MDDHGLPKKLINKLADHLDMVLADKEKWNSFLQGLEITAARHVQIATEGALVGSLMKHGFNTDLVIISDDAGQFNVFLHGLCWIHAERSINNLVGFSDKQRNALENKKTEIWEFYQELKNLYGNLRKRVVYF